MADSLQYDILASAIVRRLASPTRVASPAINRLASTIASQVRARSRIASPARVGVDPNLVASAVVQHLASPVPWTPESLASVIASRVSSPARSTLRGAAVKTDEIDFESLADLVTRQKNDAADSTKAATDLLASAITSRLRKPTLQLSPIAFEELVTKAAEAINRRLTPAASPVSQLGTDTVDASQVLKSDADRKAKKRSE